MPAPDASCHHCHVLAPLPAAQLKRTHPLRSGGGNAFNKNISFLYKKFHGVSLVPPPPPPPPPTHGIAPPTPSPSSSLPHSPSSSLPHSLPHSSPHSSTYSTPHYSPRSSPLPVTDTRPALVIDCEPTVPPVVPVHRGPLPPLPRERSKRGAFPGLQAVLLVGAYALLLVLAVVVGVVLTQDARRPAPRPVLRPRPRPQELDYVDIQPNPLSGPPPQQHRPAPRPAPPPLRRPTFSNADTDFSLSQQQPQEEDFRGRKEPAIKILKSWNNKNADGTLSWGYISEDGNFKNETRGRDCVVRGVYGYVEKETGKLLSFPYVSGNPCDPNEPDYYDYYDDVAPAEEFLSQNRPRAG